MQLYPLLLILSEISAPIFLYHLHKLSGFWNSSPGFMSHFLYRCCLATQTAKSKSEAQYYVINKTERARSKWIYTYMCVHIYIYIHTRVEEVLFDYMLLCCSVSTSRIILSQVCTFCDCKGCHEGRGSRATGALVPAKICLTPEVPLFTSEQLIGWILKE